MSKESKQEVVQPSEGQTNNANVAENVLYSDIDEQYVQVQYEDIDNPSPHTNIQQHVYSSVAYGSYSDVDVSGKHKPSTPSGSKEVYAMSDTRIKEAISMLYAQPSKPSTTLYQEDTEIVENYIYGTWGSDRLILVWGSLEKFGGGEGIFLDQGGGLKKIKPWRGGGGIYFHASLANILINVIKRQFSWKKKNLGTYKIWA